MWPAVTLIEIPKYQAAGRLSFASHAVRRSYVRRHLPSAPPGRYLERWSDTWQCRSHTRAVVRQGGEGGVRRGGGGQPPSCPGSLIVWSGGQAPNLAAPKMDQRALARAQRRVCAELTDNRTLGMVLCWGGRGTKPVSCLCVGPIPRILVDSGSKYDQAWPAMSPVA